MENAIDNYYKSKTTLRQLAGFSKNINKKIATKEELTGFLSNKFLVSLKALQTGISEKKIIQKTEKLFSII